ncbi:protein KTI12 homolog [Schistocerca gregaria]|uniref:protein KTI12 homolog n=1 Tax=Schistocerca gregaria TaxID=7010 RepID=UPI00211EB8F4|nr:protein KTI12 homolog [Schistocerca gregaria]
MPLIMMCGIPSSGKTTRALELCEYLQSQGRQFHLVNEELLFAVRTSAYKDETKEKMTRGALKAEIKRNLTKETVVIADSLNYIKGCRYELYLLAREAGTNHGVIYCDTSVQQAKKWNSSREGDKWEESQLNELANRFEMPNPSKRWDKPCVIIKPEQPLPLTEIEKMLTACPAPNSYATHCSRTTGPDYLFNIEKAIQRAIQIILEESNRANCIGQQISIENCSVKVNLVRGLTMAKLQRLKKQYLTLIRQMANTQESFVAQTQHQVLNSFLEYVNGQISESA